MTMPDVVTLTPEQLISARLRNLAEFPPKSEAAGYYALSTIAEALVLVLDQAAEVRQLVDQAKPLIDGLAKGGPMGILRLFGGGGS